MVEIGRVRVKTGNAPIEQKISAYPPQADICAFVSTSLETKRAARRPSQGSGRPKCKREGVAEDRFGVKS
jgi:predicted Zn-ribbon and HTH transcriptional regulator